MRIVWDTVKFFIGRGVLYGALLGLVYVTTAEGSNLGGGIFFGMPFGAFEGLLIGLVDGLLIGAITHRFFNPVRGIKRFRWSIVLLVALATYGGAYIFWFVVLPLLFSGRANEFNWHYFMLFQLPMLLAVVGMTYVAFTFVKHNLTPPETPSPEVPAPVEAVSS